MRSRIEQALSEAPAKVAEFLSPILLADDFDATLSSEQFAELLTISGLEDDELRVSLLPLPPLTLMRRSRNSTWVPLFAASPDACTLEQTLRS